MRARLLFAALCALPALAPAKVPPEEAAKLGDTLTPIGAEKAGNAAGTIPAWDGGLPQQDWPRGYNPFAADKPLYTITAQNADQYANVLTEGHKALLSTRHGAAPATRSGSTTRPRRTPPGSS
jgi:hypothetical protein